MSWKRYTRKAKNLVRRNAKTIVRVNRVVTPVAAAAAAFIPVVGLVAAPVIAFSGAATNRYFSSVNARYEGYSGHRARQFGRKEFVRTGIYGAAGAAVGIGATAALGAGSFAPAATPGGQASGAYSYGAGKSAFGTVGAGTSQNAAAELTMANYAAAGGPSAFGTSSAIGAGSGAISGASSGALIGSSAKSGGAVTGAITGAGAGVGSPTMGAAVPTSSSGSFLNTAADTALKVLPTVSGLAPTAGKVPMPGSDPLTGMGGSDGGGESGWGGTLNAAGQGDGGSNMGMLLAIGAALLLFSSK